MSQVVSVKVNTPDNLASILRSSYRVLHDVSKLLLSLPSSPKPWARLTRSLAGSVSLPRLFFADYTRLMHQRDIKAAIIELFPQAHSLCKIETLVLHAATETPLPPTLKQSLWTSSQVSCSLVPVAKQSACTFHMFPACLSEISGPVRLLN